MANTSFYLTKGRDAQEGLGKPRPQLVKGNGHSLKHLTYNDSVYKKKKTCIVICLPT